MTSRWWLTMALLAFGVAAPAMATKHRPLGAVHHGHPINAWGGSHHLKLR